MSPAKRKLIAQIDSERTILERRGKMAAGQLGLLMRRALLTAMESGRLARASDLKLVVGRLIKPALDKMTPLISAGMLAGHLTGRRRTLIVASPKFRSKGKVKLSGTVYDDAINFLTDRMSLEPSQLASLKAQYNAEALRITEGLGEQIEKRLQASIRDSLISGRGAKEGITELRKAFEAQGMTPQAPHTLETVFRTQTQTAYAAGRWNAQQAPEIQEILWGYEFVTVGDDRVRPSHAAMDGTKRPKNDPIWQEWWAPVGYNCRCSNLEIFDDTESTDVPDVQPDEGFAYNAGEVFKDGIRPLLV